MLSPGRDFEEKIAQGSREEQEMLRQGEEEYNNHVKKRFRDCAEKKIPFVFGTEDDIKFIESASPSLQRYLEMKNELSLNNLHGTEAEKQGMLALSTETIEEINLDQYIPLHTRATSKKGRKKEPFATLEAMQKAYGVELKVKAYWVGEGEKRIPKFFVHHTSGNDKKKIREKERKFLQRLILTCYKSEDFQNKQVHLSGDFQDNPFKMAADGESLAEQNGHMVFNDDPKDSGAPKNILDDRKKGFGKLHVVYVTYPDGARKKMRGSIALKDTVINGELFTTGTFLGVDFSVVNQREKDGLDDIAAKIQEYIIDGPFNKDIHQPNSALLDTYPMPRIEAVDSFITDATAGGGDHKPVIKPFQEITIISDGGISLSGPKAFKAARDILNDNAFVMVDGKEEINPQFIIDSIAYSEKFYQIITPKLAKIKFSQPEAVPTIDPIALKQVDNNAIDPKNATKDQPLSTKTNLQYLADFQNVLTEMGINPEAAEEKMFEGFDFKNSANMRKLSVAINNFLIVQATDEIHDNVKELRAAHEDAMKEFLKSDEFAKGYHHYVKLPDQAAKEKFLNTPSDFMQSSTLKEALNKAKEEKPADADKTFAAAAKDYEKLSKKDFFVPGYKHPEAKDISREYVRNLVNNNNKKSPGSSGRAPFNTFNRDAIGLERMGGYSAVAGSTNETNETMRARLLHAKSSEFFRALMKGAAALFVTETSTKELELRKANKHAPSAVEVYRDAVKSFTAFYLFARQHLGEFKLQQAANDTSTASAADEETAQAVAAVGVTQTSPRVSGLSFLAGSRTPSSPKRKAGEEPVVNLHIEGSRRNSLG